MTKEEYVDNCLDFIVTVGNNSDTLQRTIVFPDNSVILGFQFGNSVYEHLCGQNQLLDIAGVCGQLTRKKEYVNSSNSQTMIVKFKPWSARLFFGNIAELINSNTKLSDMLAKDIFDKAYDEISTAIDRHLVVKSFLCSLLQNTRIDQTIINAIHIINQSSGQIRVEQLAFEVCNSKRNFERRFKEAVGLTPKKFICNVRFQTSLRLLKEKYDLQEVSFMAGYYDLPHFINDFKEITGTTPEKFVH